MYASSFKFSIKIFPTNFYLSKSERKQLYLGEHCYQLYELFKQVKFVITSLHPYKIKFPSKKKNTPPPKKNSFL